MGRKSCTPALQSPKMDTLTSDQCPQLWGFFFAGAGWLHAGYMVQNPVLLATWWLHDSEKEKLRYQFGSRVSLYSLVGRDRLELSTKGL